jgi:hypothetical protein
MQGMVIDVNEQQLQTLEQLQAFLDGTTAIEWRLAPAERYRGADQIALAPDHPYINFHRPCLYAETLIDPTGRQHKRYPYELMMTPYEKFKSMPQAAKYLKPGVSFEQLDAFAGSISDNDAAKHLNEARSKLFKAFSRRSLSAA